MSSSDGTLRIHDLELLDILGSAAIDTEHIVPFECQPVDGWPFTWFLHPDIPDGTRVAYIQSFINLEAAGYIVFIHVKAALCISNTTRRQLTANGDVPASRSV